MADEATTERVEVLLRAEHFDEDVRAQIAELGDDALEVLTGCATDARASGEQRLMKSRAILALADWPDDGNALQALDSVFQQADVDNRMRATIALGEMGTDAAVQQLSDFVELADSDLERSSIVRALGVAPADSARDALMAMQTRSLSSAVQADVAAALVAPEDD